MSVLAQIANNTSGGSARPSRAPSGTAACPEGVIRIGIFFDGTSNNMYRDWGLSETARRSGRLRAPRNTEINGPTNVAKLHELYREAGTCQKKVYIIGVGGGTRESAPPVDGYSLRERYEQATGAGARLRIAVGMVEASSFVNSNNHQLAREKRVAVFGFSRGAAQARDFINKVMALGIPNTGVSEWGFGFLGPIPYPRPEHPRTTGILFEFLGVFDTVGSFGVGAIAEWGDFPYDFQVPGRPADRRRTPDQVLRGRDVRAKEQWVHRTFHAIGEDEYRDNFSGLELVGLDPGAPRQYARLPTYIRERPYPGAHADIGGGYRNSPTKSGALSHIPLKDMYDQAVAAGVPFHPFTSTLLHPNMRVIPDELRDAYDRYCEERALIFNQVLHPVGLPRLADYTRADVVYLHALPEAQFRVIQRRRLESEAFLVLARRYIHDSNTGFFVIAGAITRRVNWTRTLAIKRPVDFGGRQNSYDALSYRFR